MVIDKGVEKAGAGYPGNVCELSRRCKRFVKVQGEMGCYLFKAPGHIFLLLESVGESWRFLHRKIRNARRCENQTTAPEFDQKAVCLEDTQSRFHLRFSRIPRCSASLASIVAGQRPSGPPNLANRRMITFSPSIAARRSICRCVLREDRAAYSRR